MHETSPDVVALFNLATRGAMIALSICLLVQEYRRKRRWHRLSLLTSITFLIGISVITGLGSFTPDEWHEAMRFAAAVLLGPAFIGLVLYALYSREYPDVEPEGDCFDDIDHRETD